MTSKSAIRNQQSEIAHQQGATPAPKRLERGEVRAIVCEIIQIIAGNDHPIFSDTPLKISKYAMASRIESRFEIVVGGDRLDGWTTVEDVVDDVCRAMSRAARRKCEEAEGRGKSEVGRRKAEVQAAPRTPHTASCRLGAADPHVLVMIVILLAALVIPMTAVLVARAGEATSLIAHRSSQIETSQQPQANSQQGAMPASIDAPTLGSISAVVAATLISVNVIKRLLADAGPHMAWATRWPTWCYAVIVAAIYTGVANVAFGTLHGSLGALVWQSVYNAAIASGFFEWYRHRGSAIADDRARSDRHQRNLLREVDGVG